MQRPLLIALLASALTGACIPRSAAPSAHDDTSSAPAENLPVIKNGPWMDAKRTSEERAALVIEELSLDEKLTLVFGYYGANAAWKGYSAPREARLGSAGYVPGIARLGIPAQWQTDAGHGVATQGSAAEKRERTALPSGLATAATWNPDVAERGGAMIGAEAQASGFNVLLAGAVNLLRDQYCGRNFEYGGEDPLLAGTMVGHHIRGVQSNHIISTMKHFAVNDQETARDTGNSILEDAAARTSDLLAFELAHEIGRPGAVMCAYNRFNGEYSCESEYLLTEVLRGDWGYRGYVLSDWGAVHSTVKAANAGLEQLSGWPFDDQPYFGAPLRSAVMEGKVSETRLDEMVGRILWAMFEHGLFEHPVTEDPEGAIDMDAHAEVTRTAAEEAIVLLKNDNRLLPIAATTKKIAVIGGHADRGVLSGGGSSQVYPQGGNAVPGLAPTSWPGPVVYYPSSPVTEIKRAHPKARVFYDAGTKEKSAAQLAKESDIAIVFATQWTTESIDAKLELPDKQNDLIEAVAAANPNTIVVLETGGPVLMPWVGKVRSIVQAWYPGTEGGRAIANVLSGKVNPSGHLPLTIVRAAADLTHPKFPQPGDVSYTEGATVGYKWFDAKKRSPLFPFGYGLSYTDFEFSNLQASVKGHHVSVSFTMKNIGERSGKDVAQLYVAQDGWEAPQRLGAFHKEELQPGESKEVNLTVDPRLIATWDTAKRRWVIRAGELQLRLAKSSREIAEETTVVLEPGTIGAKGPFKLSAK